jgi:hypothetical protein
VKTRLSPLPIATEDRAFDQRMLDSMAKRIGAEVIKVKGSHTAFMTHPKVVADVIEQAARKGGENGKKPAK